MGLLMYVLRGRKSAVGDVVLPSRFHIPPWKRLLLLGAILMMAVPLGHAWLENKSRDQLLNAASRPALKSLFQQAPSEGEVAHASPWGSSAFRLGLSFFAGFIVAYVMRAVLGLTARAAFLALLVILACQYLGVTLVSNQALGQYYSRASSWLGLHLGGVRQTLQTHLPSSASVMIGWLVGFGRKRVL
jgi:uncharacterized membrane protein (Fun14 family)